MPSRPGVILFTCCLSLFMVSMDVTIVNVALPQIQRDLQATTSELQWTIDAYTLVVATLLMLAGSTADRFGRRRVFQCGMALFCAGSILCGLAPTIGWLIVFRVIQALGGTMLNPVAMAIITNTFTEPKARAQAIGLWGAVAGIAMAAGPLAGGFLTEAIGWRAIFWINVPVGIAAIVLAALFVPESRAARPRRIDWAGQALVISLLASTIAAVIEGPRMGWASQATIGLYAVAGLSFLALLIVEPKIRDPLIDLQLFRGIPFTSAAVFAVVCFGAFGAFLFLNALFLQNVLGLSAFKSGLCTLPLAVGSIVLSPISGWMVGKWGARPSLIGSSLAFAGSALMLTGLEPSTPLWFILIAFLVFGIGFGLVNTPITVTAVSGLPRDRAGVAAGIASASRQTGVSLGVALAGTAAGGALMSAPTGSADIHLLGAMHLVWWYVFGAGLLLAGLGWLATSPWGIATGRHAAHLFLEETRP